MGEPSSDTGWLNDYRPPTDRPGQRGLFASHCTTCVAAALCGEHETETACGDPAEYEAEDFHPATTPRRSLLQELTLPEPSDRWHPVELEPALVVATDYRPLDSESFALGANAVLQPAPGEVHGRIAVLTGRDDVIHQFWRRRGSLGKRLQRIGYRAAITPAYSTYWNGTPLEGLVSLRRTLGMAQLLQRDLPVIPTIGWRTGRDLQRASQWLELAGVRCLAVHLGGREERLWRWYLRGVSILRRLLPDEGIHLVAVGPATVPRIQDIARVWGPRLTIAAQKPWLTAQSGRALDEHLQEQTDLTKTRGQLLVENVETFSTAAERIIKRRGLRVT